MRLFLGIDIGATAGKAVALSGQGAVVGRALTPVTDGAAEAAHRLRDQLLAEAGHRACLGGVVATGRGRFRVPFADRQVNDVLCQARGVARLVPSARSLLDIGGRDARLVLLGPRGEIEDFLVQADCVAGLRKLLELVCAALERDLRDLAGLGGTHAAQPEIDPASTVCADHQVVSLLASGEPHEAIWAGIQRAIASKLMVLLEELPEEARQGPLVLTGGLAHHRGVVDELSRLCGAGAVVAPQPEFTAALGAAATAWTSARSRGRSELPSRGGHASRRGSGLRDTSASHPYAAHWG
jgi:predicted CoA-substrate-specific enzyme activase